MPYNCKLFVFSIATWCYNYLLKIIISYLNAYNYVQKNEYYLIEIITWKQIIISNWLEYLKLYKVDRNTCYHITARKYLRNNYEKM